VLWNGSTRPTIAVSTTVLQVSLSASDLQSIGTGSLTVSNPAPAASTSPVSQLTSHLNRFPSSRVSAL
jgi:hypothetical protein